MANINIRQLIDLAIGSPDPGHVNFCALHCLLYAFAEKLNIIDETVDCATFGNEQFILHSMSRMYNATVLQHGSEVMRVSGIKREIGGAEPEEGEAAEPPTDGVADAAEAAAGAGAEAVAEAGAGAGAGAEAGAGTETVTFDIVAENAGEAPGEVSGAAEASTAGQPLSVITSAAEEVAAAPQPVSSRGGSASMLSKEQSVQRHSEVFVADHSMDRIGHHLSDADTLTVEPFDESSIKQGLAIMKNQIELAMEQLIRLTYLRLHPTTDKRRAQQIRSLAHKLRSIQKANIFIEGSKLYHIDTDELSWDPTDAMLEAEAEEAEESVRSRRTTEGSIQRGPPVEKTADDDYDMDMHLCYTPEKLLEQLLILKSELCVLTNKVSDLNAKLLDQESQHTTLLLQELQDKVRDQNLHGNSMKEEFFQLDMKLSNALSVIEQLSRTLQTVLFEKIDKSDVAILLADKVDYTQLQRKVAKEQLQELQCRTEKQFCELQKIVNLSERNMQQTIDNLRNTLGISAIEEVVKSYTDKVNRDIVTLFDLIKKYMLETSGDCVAAGARIKVLQDLACLSCDTTCVMRTMERAKVGKLPNAKASNMLSPLITYELGTIRKSGIMGYYRKDEFPHAPHAWMKRNMTSMKSCVPRHAGGAHTTHTAKDHVEKVLLSKK